MAWNYCPNQCSNAVLDIQAIQWMRAGNDTETLLKLVRSA